FAVFIKVGNHDLSWLTRRLEILRQLKSTVAVPQQHTYRTRYEIGRSGNQVELSITIEVGSGEVNGTSGGEASGKIEIAGDGSQQDVDFARLKIRERQIEIAIAVEVADGNAAADMRNPLLFLEGAVPVAQQDADCGQENVSAANHQIGLAIMIEVGCCKQA